MKMVVANWKMNHLHRDALAFCTTLQASYKPVPGVVAAIALPATLLSMLSDRLGSKVPVYGQNGHAEPKGAFTGELSMAQLQDAGCAGVLLGHSERRQYFFETEDTLVPKVRAARKAFEMLPQAEKLISNWQRGSFEKGRAEGHAEGVARSKAADVLDVLDARALPVTTEQRERILGCSDLELLKAWLRRAATAAATDELFSA